MKSPLETSEGEHLAIPMTAGRHMSRVPGVHHIVREFRPDDLDLDDLTEVFRRLLSDDSNPESQPLLTTRADLRLVPSKRESCGGPTYEGLN